MLLRVAPIRTDVSEERNACIIRVTRMSELGTTLAVTSNRSRLRRENLKYYTIFEKLRCSYMAAGMATLNMSCFSKSVTT
jgi:hypothetical protein